MSESFIKSLSTPQPVPGGGAAAAFGALVGLALLEKIIRLELKRNLSSPEKVIFWEGLLSKAIDLAQRLGNQRDEDGRAYTALAEARSSGADAERLSAALEYATEIPLQIMRAVPDALDCAVKAAGFCGKHLISDLLVSAELLSAGGLGAGHIAGSNLRIMAADQVNERYWRVLEQLQKDIQRLMANLQEVVSSRQQTSQPLIPLSWRWSRSYEILQERTVVSRPHSQGSHKYHFSSRRMPERKRD